MLFVKKNETNRINIAYSLDRVRKHFQKKGNAEELNLLTEE